MLYVILYIILTAVSTIAIHVIGSTMPIMLMIFFSTTIAVVFFTVINIRNIGNVYLLMWENKTSFILLSFTLFCTWFGSFLIPIYFSPTIHLFTYMTMLSICGSFAIYRQSKKNDYKLKFILLMLTLILFYILLGIQYNGGRYIVLIIATIATGISGFSHIKMSEKFNSLGIKAAEVLAVRFWFLWIFSMGYSIYNGDFMTFKFDYLWQSIIISFICLISPVYFSLKSVEKLGANISSVYMGFTPSVCFIFGIWLLKKQFGYELIFAVLLAIILIIFYVYSRWRSSNQNM